MKKNEWILLGSVTAFIDLIQFILDFFVIGAVVNRIIEVIVGFSLLFYFQIRGVSMFNPKRAAAFLATLVGETIPVVDALPLWTFDVYVTYLTTKGEEVLMEKAPNIVRHIQENQRIAQKYQAQRQPKNQNGVRMPNSRENRPDRPSTPPPLPPSASTPSM